MLLHILKNTKYLPVVGTETKESPVDLYRLKDSGRVAAPAQRRWPWPIGIATLPQWKESQDGGGGFSEEQLRGESVCTWLQEPSALAMKRRCSC